MEPKEDSVENFASRIVKGLKIVAWLAFFLALLTYYFGVVIPNTNGGHSFFVLYTLPYTGNFFTWTAIFTFNSVLTAACVILLVIPFNRYVSPITWFDIFIFVVTPTVMVLTFLLATFMAAVG